MSEPRFWARRTVCKLPVGVWLLAGAGLLATVMAVALGGSAFRAHREPDHVQGPPALSKVAGVDPSPVEENDEQALIEGREKVSGPFIGTFISRCFAWPAPRTQRALQA